jgi:hypothetical protein
LVKRTFSLENQDLFAVLSGDFNPLHFDTAAARRGLIGRPVVHGIHVLLWALAASLPASSRIARVTGNFRSPLAVSEVVFCAAEQIAPGTLRIACRAAGRDVMTAEIDLDLSSTARSVEVPNTPLGEGQCRARDATDLSSARGSLDLSLDREALRRVLPEAAARLSADQVAIFLATTRLVGMHCPGLYSIYAGLDLCFATSVTAGADRLDWRVSRFDARFSHVTIEVSAPSMRGTVGAFLRPKPVAQPSFCSIKDRLDGHSWPHRRPLVIGGSRGLGEVCSKMLAAGGADVRLTYHRGAADAERVAAEIAAGGGQARALLFDVLAPSTDLATALGTAWLPTHLYYFATPPVVGADRRQFSHELLAAYHAYYVAGFLDTIKAVRDLTSAPLTVFYPSSVFVDTPPLDMREYAAAKSSGEAACRSLAANDKTLTIQVERLPRVLTDLTATVMPVETADPIALLLPILARG